MPPQIVSPCVSLVLMLWWVVPNQIEDVKLREKAVELLNRSKAVSLPGALRNYRQEVSFTARGIDGILRKGEYLRISAGAAGYREEFTFGEFHRARVILPDRMSDNVTGREPPEVRALRKQLPAQLGSFDQEDVILAIEEASVLGRDAKCINFHSRFGNSAQSNQICVDAERDALLRWEVGDELIENTEYFSIESLWEPGRIRRYAHGQLQMEIEQKITNVPDPSKTEAFAPPSGHWDMTSACENMRPPVALSTPMPPPGSAGTGTIEVVVHGVIGADGTLGRLQIESSPRPDLNEEALKIVSGWTYAPLLCNDSPAFTTGNFVVHFQDR